MRRVVVGLAMAVATLTPTWALANDQQIAQQIIQKLDQQKQAGQLKGFGIDLQVEDGTVFMNGRVSTPEQQQLALGIAQRTPGVKQVVNGLEIRGKDNAAAAAEAEADKPKTSSLLAGWGSSVKKALGAGGDEADARQVANHEPVVSQSSAMGKPMAVKTLPSYASEAGSGLRAARVQQSQYVAHQEAPGYAMPAPPVPQTMMAPRTLQSQYVAANPMARTSLPGHNGPARPQTPVPMSYAQAASYYAAANQHGPAAMGAVPYGSAPVAAAPLPATMPGGVGVAPARYDHPNLPGYAWPSYASHPNYAAVTYPKQYSPTAWPYIGPFYPYPQVPLGWRKVTLEWDDGWWMLDFKDQSRAWKPYR